MTTSIKFAKAVTESNLQGNTDKNFSREETASIQHTNAAIRQAVRRMPFHVQSGNSTPQCRQCFRLSRMLCWWQPKVMLGSTQSQKLR